MKVYLSDYMHLGTAEDCTAAVTAALEQCRREKDSTLVMAPGEYHFRPEYASAREYYFSNNDGGRKRIAFLLDGFDGLTIEGNGAELIFHGLMTPFVIDASRNVTVRGVSIDYPRPFFSQARIVKAGADFADLRFDGAFPCRVEDGRLEFFDPETGWDTAGRERFLVTEFDGEKGVPTRMVYLAFWKDTSSAGFLGDLARLLRAEDLGGGTVRLHGISGHREGAWWVATHGTRENPGFGIQESENVLLEDVTLYHTACMGVVAQTTKDITLRRVRTAQRGGRLLTVSADATHFVHCSGTVLLEDCYFCNMLDDAGNFHGNYTLIDRVADRHTFFVKMMHRQQRGVQIYRPGDEIALVDRRTLGRTAMLTVESARLVSEERILLRVREELPECAQQGAAVENFSQMPEVIIRGCKTGWNRPRGFLISTCRKALIENCEFSNMNCAVHLTGDANSWFESGCVRDLTIRGCRFADSAYAGGAVIQAEPAIADREENYYHGNLVIEDNLFEQDTPRILLLMNTENVVFRGNRWRKIESVMDHEPMENGGFRTEFCRNVEIEPMRAEEPSQRTGK